MAFDAKLAIGAALATIRGSGGVGDGMARLLGVCREMAPDDEESWSSIERLDFKADADAAFGELSLLLGGVGGEFTGLYFGLDGLNMPSGKGIEFGCAKGHAAGTSDDQWVYECSLYPGEIRSSVLSEMYRHVGIGSEEDHVLCLGYLGLLVRAAFERVDESVALGGASERALVFGFHDGDGRGSFARGGLGPG